MRVKNIYQLIIFVSIFIILAVFYYFFFYQKSTKKISELDNQNYELLNIDENVQNELVNIEFNSTDRNGNEFYINAERALVEINNQDQNKIKLEGVISIINLKNRGIINIFANNAIYDKISNDTLFYNEVKSQFLDNSITSKNLDILFTKNVSKIYNNVVFKNDNLELNTDNILIDMKTGNIKLKMNKSTEKIKLFTKNEYLN